MLELTLSTYSNKVHGGATSVLVTDAGVLAQDVAIADTIHLVAWVAVVIFVFMEPQSQSALRIILLHFFGHKRDAEERSEEAMDIMCGIAAVNMAHKGGTCEPL